MALIVNYTLITDSHHYDRFLHRNSQFVNTKVLRYISSLLFEFGKNPIHKRSDSGVDTWPAFGATGRRSVGNHPENVPIIGLRRLAH